MLSTSQLKEVTGLTDGTIAEWVEGGIVVPAKQGGRGRGNSHGWSVTQAVGLVVAARLRATEFGLAPAGVRLVVEAFGAVEEAWLEAQFKKRLTHFVTVHHGRPLLQRKPEYEAVDVQEAFQAVKERESK
jgi:hypothetical protein